MATNEQFKMKSKGERTAFDKRVARASGQITLAAAKREAEQQKQREATLAKMWDKVDLLDMSEQGHGVNRFRNLMLENAETGKPPMIFTKPSEVARDPVDVAFGDKDFTGKNIIAVADGAAIGQDELKQLQGAFADGFTLVGRDSSLGVNYAEYEQLLGPNDAVVVLHEVAHQEQPQPQDILEA